MAKEAEELLNKVLKYFQSTLWIRKTLLVSLLLGLIGASVFYVYELIPKSYTITMTGGDILGNRHYIAKILQEEVLEDGVNIKIRPTDGMQFALEKVAERKIDLALIPGGGQKIYPHVYQLASLPPEIVHLVVKPKYHSISQLKGAVINVGETYEGTRSIVTDIMRFSGFEEGVDYGTSSLSSEDLVSVPGERLPDAIFVVSLAPSYLVEFLVRERGYRLIDIPFPEALALRNGWAANVTILPYTYNVDPPVPATAIKSVGVPMLLVTHDRVNPMAAVTVMKALFGSAVGNRVNVVFSDANITASTGYPLSPVIRKYQTRNESFLSMETVEHAQDWFAAAMSVASVVLVVYRWFGGKAKEPEGETADAALSALLVEMAALSQPGLSADQREAALLRLEAIRSELITLKMAHPVKDVTLPELALVMVGDTRAALLAHPVSGA